MGEIAAASADAEHWHRTGESRSVTNGRSDAANATLLEQATSASLDEQAAQLQVMVGTSRLQCVETILKRRAPSDSYLEL
ncbi:hypothetical protein [Burkholderia sp. 9120]|uniref:hypothetical protein n=1 Tax=Burkholderia sp. 9120 TaxID=1500897 RepID=UPI000557F1B6|nr:hypothetical protein [Burkholderia sp. 9120]